MVPLARRARHLHAHFASSRPTSPVLARLSGRPYSFAGHANDVFVEPDALRENLAGAKFMVTDCEYSRRHIESVAPEHAHKVSVLILNSLDRFRRETPYVADGPVVAVGSWSRRTSRTWSQPPPGPSRGDGREVLIVGEGPERERLEREIAATRAPVRLLGALGNDSIASFLEDDRVGVTAVVAPTATATRCPWP